MKPTVLLCMCACASAGLSAVEEHVYTHGCQWFCVWTLDAGRWTLVVGGALR